MATVAEQAVTKAVGFLEEAPGVWSSVRLISFLLMGCVIAVVATICIYVLNKPAPSAGVVGTLGGVVTALVLNGIVAMTSRTRVTREDTCAAATTTVAAKEEAHETHD